MTDKWRENNREKYNAYHRAYYAAHKELINGKRKAYYAANKERVNARRAEMYRIKKEAGHEADGDQGRREQAD